MQTRIGVFTSGDGTLLDARTIRRLHAGDVPVIPVSVMTLEEIAPIAAALDLREAMVLEAGGAIARWRDDRWDVEPCGPPAETFLDVIREIEDHTGARLIVDTAMEESDRFLIESGDFAAIADAAADLGFSVRRGRRFLHLCRACDEGEAFSRLRDELHCDVAIGVGSAITDAELLTRADIPIIIPGPDGNADAELLARLPGARVAPAPGPVGWAAAVDDAMKSLATPRKRERRAAS